MYELSPVPCLSKVKIQKSAAMSWLENDNAVQSLPLYDDPTFSIIDLMILVRIQVDMSSNYAGNLYCKYYIDLYMIILSKFLKKIKQLCSHGPNLIDKYCHCKRAYCFLLK